jgi:hypothetical protein
MLRLWDGDTGQVIRSINVGLFMSHDEQLGSCVMVGVDGWSKYNSHSLMTDVHSSSGCISGPMVIYM